LYKKKIQICGRKKVKKHIMKIKIILFALFLATQVQAQTKVWFDTDLMIGMPDKTPREDDGITLIMALKQPQIVGMSSITYVDYSYDVINKILKWHHRGAAIPVYKGSPRADDLGVENDGTCIV
jgi:pyrimidine-specific ribonucleoside hydrolase